MAFKLSEKKCWVAEDGSFGGGAIIVFDTMDLTDQQWDTMSELSDTERLAYVYAIMAGEPLTKWE